MPTKYFSELRFAKYYQFEHNSGRKNRPKDLKTKLTQGLEPWTCGLQILGTLTNAEPVNYK